jgi:CubicO group peptidase (beta-lactamase class C family)
MTLAVHLLLLAGSAFYASANDLLTFGLAHLGVQPAGVRTRLLSDAMLTEAHRATDGGLLAATGSAGSGYGLGWRSDPASASSPPLVGHTGGMAGVATALRLLPNKRAVVVALCNTGSALPHVAADHLVAALFPEDNLTPAQVPTPLNLGAAQVTGGSSSKGGTVALVTGPEFTTAPGWLVGGWSGAVELEQNRTLPLQLAVDSDGR